MRAARSLVMSILCSLVLIAFMSVELSRAPWQAAFLPSRGATGAAAVDGATSDIEPGRLQEQTRDGSRQRRLKEQHEEKANEVKQEQGDEACPDVNTQPNFDIEAYISKRWYVQEQMLTRYLPANANNCVTAKYTKRATRSFWGYSLKVQNNAKFDGGKPRGGELCAYSADKSDAAKLAVAPCWLPRFLAGPYWVLRFNRDKGYALISGGQPKVQGINGCRTGKGTNNAGLWIFTREAFPAAGLVDEVRAIAAQWFDLSVLTKVNHTGCTGVGYGSD